MHITERASKAEILSASLELTDSQAATIERLHQQQRILWAALAALTAWRVSRPPSPNGHSNGSAPTSPELAGAHQVTPAACLTGSPKTSPKFLPASSAFITQQDLLEQLML